MKEVVIIGGGVSGIMCAITIKEELKEQYEALAEDIKNTFENKDV